MELPFGDLVGFFEWLTAPAGGAFIIVAWFASWALERYAWWNGLSSMVKSVAIVGVAAVIAVGAQYAQGNQAFLDAVSPYFGPVMAVIVAWLGTQTAHALNPYNEKG